MKTFRQLAGKIADLAGAWYLTGPGAGKLQRILPNPLCHGLILTWQNVLVIAPHPDDEIFGSYLLLKQLQKKAAKVTIAFATDGGAYSTGAAGDRRAEAEASVAKLGARGIFWGLRDGELAHTAGLAEIIAELTGQIQPDAVVLPWFGEAHSDHRALAWAASQYPLPQADYLFYSTFSPPWPFGKFRLSFLMGGEEKVRAALARYPASVNEETVDSFIVLRKTLAKVYLNNPGYWEPYLGVDGVDLPLAAQQAASLPQVYPTLKKIRHWGQFFRSLQELATTAQANGGGN